MLGNALTRGHVLSRRHKTTVTGLLLVAIIALSAPGANAAVSVGAPTVIPPTTGTNLSVDPSGVFNLDWARWLFVPPASYNHKAGTPPPALISTYTPIGSSGTTLLTNPIAPFVIPPFKWNPGDGTPIGSVTPPLVRRAVVRGGPGASIGSGFVISSAASNTSTRLLTVYVGARLASGLLQIGLSDPPNPTAPPINVPLSSPNGYTTWEVPIKYLALGTSGQLKVVWRETACTLGTACSVNLQAATLR